MNFLSYLYGRSWSLLLASCVASLIAGASGVALVALMTRIHASAAAQVAELFFSVCVLHLFARTLTEIILLKLTQSSVLNIRLDMSGKLLSARLAQLNYQGKAELLTILTRDIESLIAAMTSIPMVMTYSAILIGCLAYMAWLAWDLFLIFLATLSLSAITYYYLKLPVLNRLVKLRKETGRLYEHFHDLVEGRRELKLNINRGRRFIDEVLQADAISLKQSHIDIYSRLALVTNFGDALFYLVIGGLLFIVPQFLEYEAAVLTAFSIIVLYLIGPLSKIMNAIPVIIEGTVAYRQLNKLDATLCSDVQPESTLTNPFAGPGFVSLVLQGVTHHYPGDREDERFPLGPLNLKIEAGEILFIVGGNGSGKTTLAMLLLGLYQPEQGSMWLNGMFVTSHNLQAYRQHFSAVFADFHLLRHLLLEPDDKLNARAQHYLRKLGLENKVRLSNGRFSTVALSSGQRKRLALVCAYLEDRDVYLFDEWASDQDPVFKRVFYCELLPELRATGKTVIVISHDDAYFTLADRVVQLQDGCLTNSYADCQGAIAKEQRQ